MNPLRVCIDARLVSGKSGGVEQFIIGLASGLSALTDGSEEYFFLAHADSKDWLTPFVGGSCRILEDVKIPKEFFGRRIIKQTIPILTKIVHNINPLMLQGSIRLDKSNGLIEKTGVDVMHFTRQSAFLTNIPSIYHPHDLQHVHLPELYTLRAGILRSHILRSFCEKANMISVVSTWVKRDLIHQFQLPEEKIKIIPFAPVNNMYPEPTMEDLAVMQSKFALPKDFIFYPAQTWPHKNHIGLLKSLAFLRTQMNVKITAVFSGTKNNFYKKIHDKVKELELKEQVLFLGFVNPGELRGLYKLCRAVVIPTKFEAASFPLWEGFMAGAPVACSNVTSLPAQAGNSALIFDPDNIEEMALQIYRLWVDEKLRSELVGRGYQNVSRFSWERTARVFRAHYRRIAKYSLTDEDEELLLSSPPF